MDTIIHKFMVKFFFTKKIISRYLWNIQKYAHLNFIKYKSYKSNKTMFIRWPNTEYIKLFCNSAFTLKTFFFSIKQSFIYRYVLIWNQIIHDSIALVGLSTTTRHSLNKKRYSFVEDLTNNTQILVLEL